ncbi:thermonuclease family protein [Vacuolonema iberomarrocanum]|uniref:thermonuclease family protein n=1 Tax=Vacuolonema iberomarrocanum TaxID=3454632 RepID=UPI003F6E3270
MWSFLFPSARAWLRALRLALPVYAGTIGLWFGFWYLTIMSLVSMAIGANVGDISRLLTLSGIAGVASGLWWSLLILLYGAFSRWVWRSPPSFLTLPQPLRRAAYHFLVGWAATFSLALIRAIQLLAHTAPPELTQRTILQTAIAAFPDFVVPYFWVWWVVAAYGYHWFLEPRGRSQARSPRRESDRPEPRRATPAGSEYASDVEYALEELRRELEQRNGEPDASSSSSAADDSADAPPMAPPPQTSSSEASSNAPLLVMVTLSLLLGLGVLFLLATVLLLPFPDVNLPLPGLPRPITATVANVGDGDTLRVNMADRPVTIRLACIDAPESAQPGGVASTTHLRQLLPVGQFVGVRRVDIDFYGRTVAELYRHGQSVNVQMVREGHAVVYPQYLDGCPGTRTTLLSAEAEAKAARRNFWSQPNPEMPWEWRRRHRRRRRSTAPPTCIQETVAGMGAGKPALIGR